MSEKHKEDSSFKCKFKMERSFFCVKISEITVCGRTFGYQNCNVRNFMLPDAKKSETDMKESSVRPKYPKTKEN